MCCCLLAKDCFQKAQLKADMAEIEIEEVDGALEHFENRLRMYDNCCRALQAE